MNSWLSPADVGRRVTIRRQTPRGLADTVGTLMTWVDAPGGTLFVQTRRGDVAELQALDITAARVVPPEVSALQLQEISEAAMPADEQEMLGDWALRYDGGNIGRANSVRLVGSPHGEVADALDYVREWYARRGARAMVQTPEPSAFGTALLEGDWEPQRECLVMTKELTGLPPVPDPAPDIAVAVAATPEWRAVAAPDLARGLDKSLQRTAHQRFISVFDGGIPVSVGRLVANHGWGIITSVRTVDLATRRGHATTCMAAIEATAWSVGIRNVMLQVLTENAAAQALYTKLGYSIHHRYRYFVAR